MAAEGVVVGGGRAVGSALGGRGGSPNDPVKFTRFDAGAGAPVETVLGDAVVRVGGDIDPDQLAGIIRAVRQA